MGCTKNELLERISSRELSEQSEYDRLEPFSAGEKVFQWQIAQLTWVIAETNRDKDIKPDPYKIEEFMPKFVSDSPPDTEYVAVPKKQSLQDQLAVVNLINAAWGRPEIKQ